MDTFAILRSRLIVARRSSSEREMERKAAAHKSVAARNNAEAQACLPMPLRQSGAAFP